LFSFIGYKPVEYNVTDEREINIVLFPDEMVLDEVIVVGYGVQKRSDVTGSVASVSPEPWESAKCQSPAISSGFGCRSEHQHNGIKC
ncbi:MAG: hypothetical protein IPI37_02925, partial [Bacteroidales bacterium]|nr:hypothetical protein [Bacteroidales bacterium]